MCRWSARGQQANLPQPLTIEPAVAGQGEWVSTSIYRFVPDTPFAGATIYNVSVAAGLEDIAGGVLADAYAWQFTTLRPSVVSIEPENGATLVNPETPVTITFNMPMDRASTETAVSLRSSSSTASLIYGWSDDDRVLTITPQRRLDLASDYQVGISVAARSASGQANLDKDTVSGFTTVPFPAVVGSQTQPGGSWPIAGKRGVGIFFASPMDWDALDGRIQITPEPARVIYNVYDPNGTDLYLDFRLKPTPNTPSSSPATPPTLTATRWGRIMCCVSARRKARPSPPSIYRSASANSVPASSPKSNIINRNVSRLDVNLYNLGLPIGLINDPYNVTDYRPAADPDRSWSVTPETPRGSVGVYRCRWPMAARCLPAFTCSTSVRRKQPRMNCIGKIRPTCSS